MQSIVFLSALAGLACASPRPYPEKINGYSAPQILPGAIHAPSTYGHSSYVGQEYHAFSKKPAACSSTCASACSSDKKCHFFNSYVVSKNSKPEGLYCTFYSESLGPAHATNHGYSHGHDKYTISQSYGYSVLPKPKPAHPKPKPVHSSSSKAAYHPYKVSSTKKVSSTSAHKSSSTPCKSSSTFGTSPKLSVKSSASAKAYAVSSSTPCKSSSTSSKSSSSPVYESSAVYTPYSSVVTQSSSVAPASSSVSESSIVYPTSTIESSTSSAAASSSTVESSAATSSSTVESSAAAYSSTVESSAAASSTVESSAAASSTVESSAAASSTVESSAAASSTVESSAAASSTVESSAAASSTVESSAAASSTVESSAAASTTTSTSSTPATTPTPAPCPTSDCVVSSGTYWSISCGTNYYGADNANSPQVIESLDGCIAACAEDSGCIAVSWLPGTNGGPSFCYMKDSVTNEVYDSAILGAEMVDFCGAVSSTTVVQSSTSDISSTSSAAASTTDVSSTSSAAASTTDVSSSSSAAASTTDISSTSSAAASTTDVSSTTSAAASTTDISSSSSAAASTTDVSSTTSAAASSTSSSAPTPTGCGLINDASFENPGATTPDWAKISQYNSGGTAPYLALSLSQGTSGSKDGSHVGYAATYSTGSSVTFGNTIEDVTEGVEYTVTFWQRRNTNGQVAISVDGIAVWTSPSVPDTQWYQYSFTFTAASDTAALAITATSVVSSNGYMWDAFTIVPTDGVCTSSSGGYGKK